MVHYALQSLSFWFLKMGKTTSQNPNQPKYAFYRV
nr:MAG TPA: Protein A6 VIRUS, A6, POXVIRUSES, VIRION.6A [Caudoviricetes sp.]